MRRQLGLIHSLLQLGPSLAWTRPRRVDPAARRAAFDSLTGADLSPAGGLTGPLEVRWSDQDVPFVIAEEDGDLALGLGLVHAHLRGAQLQILKRIAQGRLSEMLGPATLEIDHALRLIDFGRATRQIVANWPADTRGFMDRFVAGLNHYQQLRPQRSPDLRVLGIRPEPWAPEDLLTIGRLGGADVNWGVYLGLLPHRDRPDWPEIFRAAMTEGVPRPGAFTDAPDLVAGVAAALEAGGRTGSNSLVVSPRLMATGAAAMAGDPHLGYLQPSTWLVCGARSRARHVVGLMIPGLPFVALGRNPHMAWGGTNLCATASDLYDVAGLDPGQIRAEPLTIRVRGWRSARFVRRVAPQGPIVSDARALPTRPGETLALRWVGHEPTDEVTAFLRANQATTPDAFRAAFAGFGVSGQNLLFAHRDGTIGRIFAATQPRRTYHRPPDLVLQATNPDHAWQGFEDATSLPMILDPEAGYLASGNDPPPFAEPVLGWFQATPDRARRMGQRVTEGAKLTLGDLKSIQLDVRGERALACAQALVPLLEEALPAGQRAPFLRAIATWDGTYAIESAGAAAFELLLGALVPRLFAKDDPNRPWPHLSRRLASHIAAMPLVERSVELAAAVAEAATRWERHRTWGELHRIRIGHLLSNLPVVGGGWVEAEPPVSGSRDTVLKSLHGYITGRHTAQYGSQSRHVHDLADEDANWFVLFGGQDGWPGSPTFSDQARQFLAGDYMEVPLRLETVRARFGRVTRFGAPEAAA